ncbi:MAG: PQQ-binding-like beta-propeller repeat protein, partial [Roseibacillus sp.]
ELNLQEKYGKDTLWWDEGTSPVLAGGLLVVAVMQTEGGSYLVGLDKKTSKEVWKTGRNFDVAPESGDSYSTPLVMDIDGQETIVTWGADHLTGHDPKTGEQLWFCGGFNPTRTKFWRVISSPAATDGIVVVTYARGDVSGGLRVGGKGEITKDVWLWKREGIGADAASPAAHEGKFYIVNDNKSKKKPRGLVSCLDAVTGETIWEEQLPKSAQSYYSSPLLAGNRLYIAQVNGTVFCGTVTKTGLTNLTANKLDDRIYASPVAIGSRLYIRGRNNLYCFGK